MKCSECQKEIPEGSVFCPVCGSAQFGEPAEVISRPVAEEKAEAVPATEESKPAPKKKKWWILAAAGLLLAVAVALVIFLHRPSYVMYSTFEGLFLSDLSGGRPVLLVEEGYCDGSAITEDQKYLFYRAWKENIKSNDLYYLDLRSPFKKPEKLAEGVSQFYVNAEGTRVAYIRDRKLFVHDMNSEKLIAENVYRFLCDEDVDTFAYAVVFPQDMDIAEMASVWYFRDGDANPKKIGIKGSQVRYLSDDGKTLLYSASGDLFVRKDNEGTMIAKNAGLLGDIYEDGSFYYKTRNEKGHDIYRFYDGEKSIDIPATENVQAGHRKQPTLWWQDESNERNYVAIREQILEMPLGQMEGINISDDGKTLSVLMEGKNTALRDLYVVDVAQGQVRRVLQDARSVLTWFVGNKLYYVASTEGMPSALYCDGEEILSGVRQILGDHPETGDLLVRGEISAEGHAPVYMVCNGKPIKLMDQGRGAFFAANGDAIVAGSSDGLTRELWRFDRSGKGTLLATEVTALYDVDELRRPGS